MSQIYASKTPEISQREITHMQLSRSLAGECAVLLENDGALPLAEGRELALFGNGARQTIKGGTGSGDVNTRSNITIEQGLIEAGFTITTTDWLDRNGEKAKTAKQAYISSIPQRAKELNCSEFVVTFAHPFKDPAPEPITEDDLTGAGTDTAVYVISRNSGEGADRGSRRGDYLLFNEEKEQLELLGKTFQKVVLLLNIGGVIDMTEIKAIPGINAVLLLSQLGNTGGQVAADVLTGKVNPSGKLTDTWAKRYGDYPAAKTFSSNDGNVDDEYYAEGIYVGYRYFDTFGIEPVYPFGYGRSYTEFAIKTHSAAVEDGAVKVRACVSNVGGCAGKEVVQVYSSSPRGSIPKPFQELRGFAKTGLLAPGDSETLEISFPVKDMASYCEECACWMLEEGEYIIRVGSSSRHTEIAAVLTLDRQVKTVLLKNLFADSDPVQEITAPEPARDTVPAGAIRISVNAADIKAEQAVYQGSREAYSTSRTEKLTMDDVKSGRCTVEELTAQLSIEELADFCVGTLRESGSIVGNASHTIPGAAGDTSSVAKESRGIKNMILADGPAGLRLQPVFKTDKAGQLLPGGDILGDRRVPFPDGLDENEVDTYYQYCTAIPIGWALAQAWNPALLTEIGKMIGEEMEQFGVDLWLAPALNIHRDPLCGRNFEYYSEDPLVSGKAAAAITNGVQSHPGKGTTIKHFAANNQEDNRYFTNSHISERALREIYLRGFEIAVKDSQPLSIMTSYNLINGIHTANSRDLLQAVARDEWGFQGVVMTDWFTSQHRPEMTGGARVIYPISASTGCIYAGNDIQMPGGQENVDDIVEAVKTGKMIDGYQITLADLQFNAANVIRAVEKTTVC